MTLNIESNKLKYIIIFFLCFLFTSSCNKKTQNIKPEDSVLEIEIGHSFWGRFAKSDGQIIEEPFYFFESNSTYTGKFTFDYNPKGNYTLTFYPSKNKIVPKSIYISPGPNLMTSDSTIYAILKKNNNSTFISINDKTFSQLKITFQNNDFGLLKYNDLTQVERLTNGIQGNLIEKPFIKIENKIYTLE